MGKHSKVRVEVKSASSCPNNDNDESSQHIKETKKRKRNKNLIVNTCETEVNVKQCDTNMLLAIPNQPGSAVEPVNYKMDKKKIGTSPEDEPIDEAELDAFCGELDEEANSTLASWINLLEAKLSERNSSQDTGKKKRKKIKATDSNDTISELQEQGSSDSVQKK